MPRVGVNAYYGLIQCLAVPDLDMADTKELKSQWDTGES